MAQKKIPSYKLVEIYSQSELDSRTADSQIEIINSKSILEFDTLMLFPEIGSDLVNYKDMETGNFYYWDVFQYILISNDFPMFPLTGDISKHYWNSYKDNLFYVWNNSTLTYDLTIHIFIGTNEQVWNSTINKTQIWNGSAYETTPDIDDYLDSTKTVKFTSNYVPSKIGTAVLDFGNTPINEKEFLINESICTSTSNIRILQVFLNQQEENFGTYLDLIPQVDNGWFKIIAIAREPIKQVRGIFNIKYIIQ